MSVRLTRRVTFSAGHRYWIPSRSEEVNRALFGKWASPYNHGHNYILDVTADGPIDDETGMVVNIKRIDDVLQERVVGRFDQRSINDEIPEFHDQASSLENLLLYFKERLSELPEPARLVGLRLEEMPTLWANLDLNDGRWTMTLTRTYEFAAAHRLDAPSLTRERNWALYGKCNNPAGHGHNYVLEVTVSGEPAPDTGFLADLGALDEAVNTLVVDRFDHKNLNEDLPEFAGKITTSEVVAKAIWDALDGKLPAPLERVKLWETARNAFEVCRDK